MKKYKRKYHKNNREVITSEFLKKETERVFSAFLEEMRACNRQSRELLAELEKRRQERENSKKSL